MYHIFFVHSSVDGHFMKNHFLKNIGYYHVYQEE